MDLSISEDESLLNAVKLFEDSQLDASVQFVETQEEQKSSDEDVPDEKYKLALKVHFGHNRFRPLQWKIIRSILLDKK